MGRDLHGRVRAVLPGGPELGGREGRGLRRPHPPSRGGGRRRTASTDSRLQRRLEELRRRAGALQGRLRGAPRRGDGARRRQRRRQVDADQGHRRDPRVRRGRGPLRGRAGDDPRPARRRPRSGSRSSTRTSRSRTTSTSSRTCSSAASGSTGIVLDEPSMERAARETLDGALGDDAALGAAGRRRALRRAAAGGRGREGGDVELEGRHPRRADRRARRRADAPGARPRAAARRPRARRRDHLAQPPRHLRGRRPDHRAPARPVRRPARAART